MAACLSLVTNTARPAELLTLDCEVGRAAAELNLGRLFKAGLKSSCRCAAYVLELSNLDRDMKY